MTRRWLKAIGIAMALTGCATGYQKSGMTGGYTDQRLSDSAYYVEFSGNGYASSERVHTFWLYRCAEVTLEHGFDFFVLKEGKRVALDDSRATVVPAVWHPDRDGGQLIKTRGGGGYTYTYIPGTTITTYDSKGTVLMYHQPLPDELAWAIDARKLKEQLKPYVDSNGKSRAPAVADLAHIVGVAHERIVLPTADQIAVKVADANGSAKPARSASEFAQKFSSQEIALHALFHGRKSITGGTGGGHVNLAISVTPNGIVSESHVVDTSFSDPSFVEALRRFVKTFEFAPQDVSATRVESFRIEFAPLD